MLTTTAMSSPSLKPRARRAMSARSAAGSMRIFPEIVYDKVFKVRGMDIVIVTTAKTDEEGRALLSMLGMPFRK